MWSHFIHFSHIVKQKLVMNRWIFIICILYGLLFVLRIDLIRNTVMPDNEHYDSRARKNSHLRRKFATMEDWRGCPKGDGSLESTFVSAFVDDGSGTGNQVFAYLAVWAMARRFGLRPVMPDYTLGQLSKMFDKRYFRLPSLTEIGRKCNLLPWMLDEHHYGPAYLGYHKDIFRKIQTPRKQNISMVKFGVYVVDPAGTVPFWNELAQDLVIKESLWKKADQILRDLRRDFYYKHKNDSEYKNMTLENIQFVSAHVRGSEYVGHMKVIYPNASLVVPEFYKNAFAWLKKQLTSSTLIFIVVADNMTWAQSLVNNTKDVFLPGTGIYHDAGLDLALLAACNQSIFAYGTFGMTGALLANGDYTIIFDTGNKTVTKEMQFASALPGWYIMDSKGQLQYENEILKPTYGATSKRR